MRLLRRFLVFGAGLLAGLSVALFVLRNRQAVSVNLYFTSLERLPVWALVLWSIFIGMLIPILLYLAGAFEFFLQRRRLGHRIEELEEELVVLRNLPLTEARLDLSKPRQPRPLVEDRQALKPELVAEEEALSEADLYPIVYERKES